jgi:HlyD family secretion protein
MNAEKLKNLQIDPERKHRPKGALRTIFIVVIVATGVALYFAWPRLSDSRRLKQSGVVPPSATGAAATNAASGALRDDVLITVSGYIINRERIELSPRFPGVVKWIGVKKGDSVTNGQVVVRLDDAEYAARLTEADGRLARARTGLTKAEMDLARITELARTDIESRKVQDDARLQVDAAQADLKQAEGGHALAKTYVDWCTIRSPIDGVILEKLVDPNELVVPQSFGGARGPSTALIALADPNDLQVEIDMSERDLSKIYLQQKCRVVPEAFPDKSYDGVVAEIAPEADRAKGTLQIKVQVLNPDGFLTPQLSARVDFLKP